MVPVLSEFVVICEFWVNILNVRFDLHTHGFSVTTVEEHNPLMNMDWRKVEKYIDR